MPRSVFLTFSTEYAVEVVATVVCETAARSACRLMDIDGIAVAVDGAVVDSLRWED